jgi:predicted transcriptional regulator
MSGRIVTRRSLSQARNGRWRPADPRRRRFVDAWQRAERGEEVDETNLTFRDLETLLAALTPKRLQLLRHVRRHHVPSVKALALDLRRDCKNVHRDVEELTRIGLLARTAERVTAPFGEVDARLVL